MPLRPLVRELLPYLVAQWIVIAVVIAAPQVVWHRNPLDLPPPAASDDNAGRDALIEQLNRLDKDEETK